MNDIDLTKKCADAMGIPVKAFPANTIEYYWRIEPACFVNYNPLHNDAQAMALIRKFELDMHVHHSPEQGKICYASHWDGPERRDAYAYDVELNRAIVKCVAKIP